MRIVYVNLIDMDSIQLGYYDEDNDVANVLNMTYKPQEHKYLIQRFKEVKSLYSIPSITFTCSNSSCKSEHIKKNVLCLVETSNSYLVYTNEGIIQLIYKDNIIDMDYTYHNIHKLKK